MTRKNDDGLAVPVKEPLPELSASLVVVVGFSAGRIAMAEVEDEK